MHSLQGMRNSPYYPRNLSEQLFYVLYKFTSKNQGVHIHIYIQYVVKRRGGMVGMRLPSWLMPLSMVCFSRTIQKLHDTYPLSIELHKHDGDDI